jgi:hypothetical protein
LIRERSSNSEKYDGAGVEAPETLLKSREAIEHRLSNLLLVAGVEFVKVVTKFVARELSRRELREIGILVCRRENENGRFASLAQMSSQGVIRRVHEVDVVLLKIWQKCAKNITRPAVVRDLLPSILYALVIIRSEFFGCGCRELDE